MIPDEDLIRVRDPSEIEPGMTLVLKACVTHGHNCTIMVFRRKSPSGTHQDSGCIPEPCHAPFGFETSHGKGYYCFCYCIPEGRLFRLRPEEPARHEEQRLERVLEG